ncbi:MAG TPA: hypothetical protein VE821_04510 [Pyrinomonadaceae bacterium]|nr:hypothetical protein [Pyrinomonadaceae bacterium]
MAQRRRQIVLPREVLLVELERRCADERCKAKNRIGLTKQEARVYRGFNCARCERWHDDALTERDVPDWWEELTVTGLDALRPRALPDQDTHADTDDDEVVARLSTAWREATARGARDTGADEA